MIDEKLIHFKASIILVLKQLRKQKDVSQADVNTDLLEKTGFIHNMGRNEVDGNFKMETLYTYCKYFNISTIDFFNRVNEVSTENIQEFLKKKEIRNKKDA
jgi:transcriptional regulator with XRE-family HTH domain